METNQPPRTVTWRKSSYSVRDSKNPDAGRLAVAAVTWTAFLHHLK
ncbi:DUF397 domain-containing protein [Streptomyces shenzhenensis]